MLFMQEHRYQLVDVVKRCARLVLDVFHHSNQSVIAIGVLGRAPIDAHDVALVIHARNVLPETLQIGYRSALQTLVVIPQVRGKNFIKY